MACAIANDQSTCTLAELQKFREIGIEAISPDDDSAKCSSVSAGTTIDLGLNKSSQSGQSGAEEIRQTA